MLWFAEPFGTSI